MNHQVQIDAVALLQVAEINEQHKSSPSVGALYGTVSDKVLIHECLELLLKDHNQPSICMKYLVEVDELYRTNFPNRRLVGWYTIGACEPQDWMRAIHQSLCSCPLYSGVLVTVLFSPPFSASPLESQVRVFNDFFEPLSVGIEMSRTTETVLSTTVVESNEGPVDVSSMLSKQKRALECLRQRLFVLLKYVESVEKDPKKVDARLYSNIHTAVCRLDALHSENVGSTDELTVLAEMLVSLSAVGPRKDA